MERTEAQFEFGLKAVNVEEDDNGDLILEGYASDFLTDRDEEAFEPRALQKAIDAFMANPVLLYHHQPSRQLGVVEEAQLDGKGLRVKARLAKPIAGSWAEHVYDLVKRGMMKGFSVGGGFKRRMTSSGPRIYEMDWQELSVTPLPVNPRTLFGVAQKAFADPVEDPIDSAALMGLHASLDRLEALYAEMAKRAA
jgi:HK97 family phage prohead protease